MRSADADPAGADLHSGRSGLSWGPGIGGAVHVPAGCGAGSAHRMGSAAAKELGPARSDGGRCARSVPAGAGGVERGGRISMGIASVGRPGRDRASDSDLVFVAGASAGKL